MLPDTQQTIGEEQSVDVSALESAGTNEQDIREYLDQTLQINPIEESETAATGDWTVATASRYFRKSPRQIQRLLKAGQLKGYKIQGPKGPEWRVEPNQLELTSGLQLGLMSKLCNLENKLTEAASELEVLNRLTQEFETQMSRLQEAFANRSEQSDDWQKELAAATAQFAQLKGQQSQLEAVIANSNAQRAQLEPTDNN